MPSLLSVAQTVCVDIALLHAYKGTVAETVQNRLASFTQKDLELRLETPIGKSSIGRIFGGLRNPAYQRSPR